MSRQTGHAVAVMSGHIVVLNGDVVGALEVCRRRGKRCDGPTKISNGQASQAVKDRGWSLRRGVLATLVQFVEPWNCFQLAPLGWLFDHPRSPPLCLGEKSLLPFQSLHQRKPHHCY